MASKRYDAFLADFQTRYERWITAQETGDPAELKAAEAALPTLNARLRAKLAAADQDTYDPVMRALEKRALVLGSEARIDEAKRRRERQEAEKRRQASTIRVGRKVELPTTCVRCGAKLERPKATGRPRVYCSPACRKAAHEDRRAHRDDAVKVQVVERVFTEIRERRIEVPHPRGECIRAVFADDDALVNVIWALIDEVRDPNGTAFDPEQARFWDLYNNVEVLHEALAHRAGTHQPRESASPRPMSKYQQNMQRMTYPHQPRDIDNQ